MTCIEILYVYIYIDIMVRVMYNATNKPHFGGNASEFGTETRGVDKIDRTEIFSDVWRNTYAECIFKNSEVFQRLGVNSPDPTVKLTTDELVRLITLVAEELDDMTMVIYTEWFLRNEGMMFIRDLICRWPRPSELKRMVNLIKDRGERASWSDTIKHRGKFDKKIYFEGHVDFYTDVVSDRSAIGKLVGKMGQNFNGVTKRYGLMYMWLKPAIAFVYENNDPTNSKGKRRKVMRVYVYGIDKKNVIRAVLETRRRISKIDSLTLVVNQPDMVYTEEEPNIYEKNFVKDDDVLSEEVRERIPFQTPARRPLKILPPPNPLYDPKLPDGTVSDNPTFNNNNSNDKYVGGRTTGRKPLKKVSDAASSNKKNRQKMTTR